MIGGGFVEGGASKYRLTFTDASTGATAQSGELRGNLNRVLEDSDVPDEKTQRAPLLYFQCDTVQAGGVAAMDAVLRLLTPRIREDGDPPPLSGVGGVMGNAVLMRLGVPRAQWVVDRWEMTESDDAPVMLRLFLSPTVDVREHYPREAA